MWIARALAATAVAASFCAAAVSAGAQARNPASDVTTNWAGYSVTEGIGAPVSFTSATATWRQPSPKCGARAAGSAIWVGLGGADQDAGGLAHLGTRAECRAGRPRAIVAFYEVIPAPAVVVKRFFVRPGDTITATVALNLARSFAQFTIENLTRRQGFTISAPVQATERHSAEWIIEAPTVCKGAVCGQADLANFGSVPFTDVAAMGNGHAGTILDRGWQATAIALTPSRRQVKASGLSHGAVPTALSADGSSFTIAWRSHTVARTFPAPEPAPAKPGDRYVAGIRR